MAGSKGSKYYNVFLDYKVSLIYQEEEMIDAMLFCILQEIKQEKSLLKASEKCGISYRKAWGDIHELEKKLGFEIVIASRGGANGGKSILSPEGENILQAYSELINEMDPVISNISKKFFNKINQ